LTPSLHDALPIFSCADNGIGFDMEFHDHIFKIFQRLHRDDRYPGTGIGLALVRKAVERLGGRVWAHSAVGQGATFYIKLTGKVSRSEEHTSELQSRENLVCRLLLEKK